MEKNDGTRAYYLFGLRIIGDFGVSLAVPAVAAGWLGTKLDASWGTKPYALFACVAFGVGGSALIIRKNAIADGAD